MVTSGPNLNTSSPTKRPFGILLAEWYFVTLTVVISARVIANLDFYIRNASRLDLHFFQFFAVTVEISELIVCVLGVFAVVGLQRMRPWGRWLAIALAVVGVASAIRFYSAVLFFGLWTLVPHHVWPNVKSTIQLGFGIYIVWYLLQPKTRLAFRPLPTSSTGQSEPNL